MFQQCELKFEAQDPSVSPTAKGASRGKRVDTKPRYLTTNEVVERLKLDSPYPLRKSRSNGSAYRSDRYVAVPAGHNRWELFRQVAS
jgi:hypothetical protein